MRDLHQAIEPLQGSMAVATAGAALFWAWVDCFLFTPSFFKASLTTAYFPAAFIVAVSFGCLTMVSCLPRTSKMRSLLFSRRGRYLCAILAAAGGTTVIGGAQFALFPLVVVGSMANGFAFGAGVLFWGCAYAVNGGRSASVLAPASFAVAAFFCILLEALFDVPAMPFVITLLPAASFLIYTHVAKELSLGDSTTESEIGRTTFPSIDEGSPRPQRFFARFGLTGSTIIGFAVFGIAFGFMQFTSVFSIEAASPHAPLQLLLARGITALALVLFALFSPGKIHIVYRVGMATMIAGFMVMPFTMFDSTSSLAPSLIVNVGYTAFDVMCWTILCETAFFRHRAAILLVGFGRTLVHGGIALGVLLGFATSFIHLSSIDSTIVVTSVGYLLVVAVILLIGDSSGIWLLLQYGTMFERPDKHLPDNEAAAASPPSGTQRSTAEAIVFVKIATRYGLTAREREIAELFGTGRSTAFIAQQLCISESTAKSHVRHIYAKCSIHNRQELLDLIDSERF